MRQRHALIARVTQLRRLAAARNPQAAGQRASARPATVPALEARISHLEKLVEGLQDAVHRESQRRNNRLAALEAQLEPTALAVALNRDARQRGL
jgi:hypothetical protein